MIHPDIIYIRIESTSKYHMILGQVLGNGRVVNGKLDIDIVGQW